MSEVTQILARIEDGSETAAEELLQVVYHELRAMARSKMARERPGNTLQATALVHEAWLSLVDSPAKSWQNRAHFFGAAAEAMRRILITRARRKGRQRRGSGAEHVSLEGIEFAGSVPDEQLVALDEALARFAVVSPQHAELVKLRFFVGLKISDAADVLGISDATAKRWWTYSKAWLFHELNSVDD